MNDSVRKFILPGGEIKSAPSDDLMEFSGWMSTDDIDLSKEIVDIGSATKNWDEYKRKGRLWLDHDPKQVLGKVHNPHMESKGIRADQCKLTDNSFNREWVWPHIKSEAFSEFSIQFKSLKGEYDKNKIYHHKEIYLLECSVVAIACNPAAVIDGFKSLIPSEEWYNASLADLRGLHDQGKLKLPSEHRRNFYVSGLKDMETQFNAQETPMAQPDFMDITVLDEAKGLDQEGEALPMPSKARRDYVDICKAVHLAESEARGSYLFRVGVPTAKGFKYEWDSVIMTFGSLLGAKGGAFFQDEEKLKAYDRLFKIYAVLGKKLPTFDGAELNELSDDALIALKFSDVTFQEGEGEVILLNVVKNHNDSIGASVKNMSPGCKETVSKWVYSNLALCFDVSLNSDEDFAFVNGVLNSYSAWKKAKEDDMYAMSFADFLADEEKKNLVDDEADVNDNVEADEPKVGDVVEVDEDGTEWKLEAVIPAEETVDLAKAFKEFLQN